MPATDGPLDEEDFRGTLIEMLAGLQGDERVSFLDEMEATSDSLCAQMTFAEVNVTLAHAHRHCKHVDLEFDMGPVPEDLHKFALQLLEINLELASAEHSGFGVDEYRNMVIYRARHWLGSADDGHLQQVLNDASKVCSEWFNEWFPADSMVSKESADLRFSGNFQQV